MKIELIKLQGKCTKSNILVGTLKSSLICVVLLASFVVASFGQAEQTSSRLSSETPGSVLVYNIYTSQASDPSLQNTRITITNTNLNTSVIVRFWFIEGASGGVSVIHDECLPQKGTKSFLASDLDIGITGYMIASAINSDGVPIRFNFLVGDEYVKLSSGHSGNLPAQACSAFYGSTNSTNPLDGKLVFDGSTGYSLLPKIVAAANIPHPFNSGIAKLILNSLNGDVPLNGSVSALGQLSLVTYDEDGTTLKSVLRTWGAQQIESLTVNTYFGSTSVPTAWLRVSKSLTCATGFTGAVICDNGGIGLVQIPGGHNLQFIEPACQSMPTSLTLPTPPAMCAL